MHTKLWFIISILILVMGTGCSEPKSKPDPSKTNIKPTRKDATEWIEELKGVYDIIGILDTTSFELSYQYKHFTSGGFVLIDEGGLIDIMMEDDQWYVKMKVSSSPGFFVNLSVDSLNTNKLKPLRDSNVDAYSLIRVVCKLSSIRKLDARLNAGVDGHSFYFYLNNPQYLW